MLLDPLIGGIAMGCIYSLIALGYNMLIRAMNLLHFAQGEVMMVGALTGVTLVSTLRVPYLVAIPLIMGICALLSLALDVVAYRPVRRRRVPAINLIIATLGVSIVLSNVAILIWGAEPLRYPRIYAADALLLGALRIPPQFLAPLVVGGVLMVGLQLFFSRSLTGLAMRAAAQDPDTARLMGIDIDRTIRYTFAISGAMGGAAGALLGPIIFASFNMGESIGIKAFVAATLGGLGSMPGAMVGGILFGVIETYGALLISSGYKDALGYIVMIAILLVAPSGLFGRRARA
jgi:branched-chain amino acid transport system permease protein